MVGVLSVIQLVSELPGALDMGLDPRLAVKRLAAERGRVLHARIQDTGSVGRVPEVLVPGVDHEISLGQTLNLAWDSFPCFVFCSTG